MPIPVRTGAERVSPRRRRGGGVDTMDEEQKEYTELGGLPRPLGATPLLRQPKWSVSRPTLVCTYPLILSTQHAAHLVKPLVELNRTDMMVMIQRLRGRKLFSRAVHWHATHLSGLAAGRRMPNPLRPFAARPQSYSLSTSGPGPRLTLKLHRCCHFEEQPAAEGGRMPPVYEV